MSNTFSFPQQLYRFNLGAKNGWNLFVAWFSAVAVQIQLGGQKTVGTCLLHVKYFQFSTAAVRSQLAGKKNGWNLFVARPASFQSLQSCRFPCCAGFLLLWGVLGAAVAGPSQFLSCMAEKSIYISLSVPFPCPILPSLLPPPLPPHTYILYAGRACAIEMHMDPSVLAAQCGNIHVHLPILQPTIFQ